ncbi:hypothetical protein FRB96_001731 [Tulasnella sp. 330]|nr:hypothetical protein FRB96_001731 [Tulasnella sp. 330]KAG8882362.1 hypothetical protein FRB97_008376 [Tulasnella sp. 331]KAG8886829.1 hypothetical protein FRB98_000965 [Tulasnella sp. 332]
MPPRSNPSPRAVQWLNAQASRGKPALDSYLGFQTVIATDIQYVNQEMLRLTAPEDVQASSSHLTEQHAVDEFGSPLDRAYDSPEPMPGQATVPFSGHPGCQTQSSLRLRDTLVFLSDHAIAAGFKKRPKSFEKLDRAMVDTVEVLFQLAQVLSFIQVGAERGAQWTSVRRKSGNYPGIKDIRAVHRQLNAGTSRLRANIESALAKIGNQLGMDRLRHQRGNGRAADLRIDRSILSSASASVFRDYTSAGGAATLTYAAGVATRGHWASVPAAVASGVTTGTNLYTLRDQGEDIFFKFRGVLVVLTS